MDKKSFVIYENWAEVIKRLPKEDAGELIQAICNYKTGTEYKIKNPYVDALFEGQIRPQLGVDDEKYQKKCERIAELNRKRREQYRNENVTKTSRSRHEVVGDNDTDNDTVNDTDNVSPTEICISNKRKRFTPPTLEEVKSYCQERKNSVDPERFINFYESKGWVVGKSPMKDWKAAVRNWEKDSKVVTTNKFKNFDERSYDMDSLEAELVAKSMSKGN